MEAVHESKMTYASEIADPAHAVFHGGMRGKRPTADERAAAVRAFARMNGRGPEKGELVYRRVHEGFVPEGVDVARIPMKPFSHYAILDRKAVEVMRVPWSGPVGGGEFRADHGRTTDRLAFYYMHMAERYATRGNWSGYTYNWRSEMVSRAVEALWWRGLKFDETVLGKAGYANPHAYFTRIIHNAFLESLHKEKRALEAVQKEAHIQLQLTEARGEKVGLAMRAAMGEADRRLFGDGESGDAVYDPVVLEDDRPLLVGNQRADSLAEAARISGRSMGDLRAALLGTKPIEGMRVSYLDI